MRRLKQPLVTDPENEQGAIAPLTAVLMVAMLGMAAFAVDTAMMYSEHAQLQNGADATALAIAESCAGGLHSVTCQKDLANANALAGSNALDGKTEVVHSKVTSKDSIGTVDVEVQAKDTAGKKVFSPVFAPIFGITEVDIRASAQAKFEGYSRAHVLPLAFSQCESDPAFSKGLQFFRVHGSSSKTLCTSKSSGLEIPGGFGWLQHDVADGNCQLQISVTNAYKTDAGGAIPADCKTTFSDFRTRLEAGKTVEVLVPIFNKVTGSGSEAMFYVEAFAQLSLRGWQFNGETYLAPDAQALKDTLKMTSADHGLFGKYTKKVSLAEAAVLGGPATYQAVGIRLSN